MGQANQININSYNKKPVHLPLPQDSKESEKNRYIQALCDEYLEKLSKTEFIKVSNSNLKLEFKWGNPFVFGTPSYWIIQTHLIALNKYYFPFSLGRNLFEETIACLLGGYGIPAEIGLEAFNELKCRGLTTLKSRHGEKDYYEALNKPIKLGEKTLRYRFPSQKAQRIASAKKYFLNQLYFPESPRELRDWLLQIPGIGFKTASWIVRHQTQSNDIAIIDIHILRAGVRAGFFLSSWTPVKNYLALEESFLTYSSLGKVAPIDLDSTIWNQMRTR